MRDGLSEANDHRNQTELTRATRDVMPVAELRRYVDPTWMTAVLRQRLPKQFSPDRVLDKCAIERYRFKPGSKSPLRVSYRLEWTEPHSGRESLQRAYAKVYARNRILEVFEKLRSSPRASASALLEDHDMAIWAFPSDPRLPQLPELTEPARVRRHLPYAALPTGVDGPDDIANVEVEVVRYQPEDRCTSRYELSLGPKHPTLPPLILFSKTFKGARGEASHRWKQDLWRSSHREPMSFRVARPLGYDQGLNTLWEELVPGVPLLGALDSGNEKTHLESAASGLATLHSTAVGNDTTATHDPLTRLGKKARALAQAVPDQAATVNGVVSLLTGSASSLTEVPRTLVHGGFRVSQLLVDRDRLGLLDWDDSRVGDPIEDVARFVGHLRQRDLAPDRLRTMTDTFIDAYRSRVDWGVPTDRLGWHLRAEHIARALHLHERSGLDPGVDEAIRRSVDLAAGKTLPE